MMRHGLNSKWAAALIFAMLVLLGATRPATAEDSKPRKIVFLAGAGSHGFGAHAHYAGCQLLATRLSEAMPDRVQAVVSLGWPTDPAVLEGASAVVVYCDGGSLISRHIKELEPLMSKGAGLACLHYTLDVSGSQEARARMLDWIGGYYEQHWSVNPCWEAAFKELPQHPVTRGVRPFAIFDEWYYHMRFPEGMAGVTPILTAVPPDITRKSPDGPHTGNPAVRARLGMPEHVAWAFQRPNGGRGFGFTGGHFHWNWAHNDFRKLVLNGIVWVAGQEVPPDGVPSRTPTVEEIIAHQDGPPPEGWKPEKIQQMIERFNPAQGGKPGQ
ncbi:MAG: ThuA domain-containing protein [Planctomycetota bacterium]